MSTEVTTVSSPHHIELCPADTGTKDRLVVQDVIKEIAMSAPIDLSTVRRNDDDNDDDDTHRDNDDINGLDCVAIDWIRWIGLRGGMVQRSFKVVVLNEVDRLSRDAQHALVYLTQSNGTTHLYDGYDGDDGDDDAKDNDESLETHG